MFHPNNQAVRPTDPYQSREELSPEGQQAVADVQASLARSDLGAPAGVGAQDAYHPMTYKSDAYWDSGAATSATPTTSASAGSHQSYHPMVYKSDSTWQNNPNPSPTVPAGSHQSYHPMTYRSDTATTPSTPQRGFNPSGWHELSVAEIHQLERDRQWVQGHNHANAAANRDGNMIWYWATWKANGKTYAERTIGREKFLYVGASGPPKSAWVELAGVSSSGLGATPTQASDGRWYCAQPIGMGKVRVMRYGLGDAASDMEVFNSAIDTGDGFLANGDYASAITSYQSAGKTGVDLVGPDIDALTGGSSLALTQQAWAVNGNLASVNNNNATQNDAQSAQGFVRQMQNYYATGATLIPAGATGTRVAGPSAALSDSANSLVAALNANGCNGVSDVVMTFQKLYDAEGQSILKQDGKYGPFTQAALQRVLDASGGGTAPPACHSPAATGGGSKTTVASSTPSSTGWIPWVIGGAVVAAGGLALVAHHKKRRA